MSRKQITLPKNIRLKIAKYKQKLESKVEQVVNINDYPEPSEPRISTMTIICNINSNIELDLLCRYLPVYEPNSPLTKTKEGCVVYVEHVNSLPRGIPNKKKKGRDPTKNRFFNQTTVLYKFNDIRKINVKIFNNGKLQMTGVQSKEEGMLAAQNIIKILKQVKCVPYKKFKELPMDGNIRGNYQVVYNFQTGFKEMYRWDSFKEEEECSWKTQQELKARYVTKNDKGDLIEAEWVNADYGVMKKVIAQCGSKYPVMSKSNSKSSKSIKMVLDKPNNTKVTDYRVVLINSDYNARFPIKNDELHKILINKYKLYSSYEPCDYPGVKTKYCWNPSNTDPDTMGKCLCSEHCGRRKKKERICKMITISVFQSGNTIITGANQLEQIREAYNFINRVFKENYTKLKRHTTIDELNDTMYSNNIRLQSFLNKKKNVVYLKKANITNNPFISAVKMIKGGGEEEGKEGKEGEEKRKEKGLI